MSEPSHLFRIYSEGECGEDGYPFAWHEPTQAPPEEQTGLPQDGPILYPAVKDLVRENAGNRCVRCFHPYTKGGGEWTPCDRECRHLGLTRSREAMRGGEWSMHDLDLIGAYPGDGMYDSDQQQREVKRWEVEAYWRVLTVHHLIQGTEGKRNLLWWNLVSLCQRCHLNVQRRVDLSRPWPWPHSDWFRPYAAGWYAWAYLGQRYSREETMDRLEELLAIEQRAEKLFEVNVIRPDRPSR